MKLDEWLIKQEKDGDIKCKKYMMKYNAIYRIMIDHYFPLISIKNTWFTDHGENHIKSIICSASELIFIDETNCKLDNYCIYILLLSIIWHDIGMTQKREGHENEISKIINEFSLIINSHERGAIIKITGAHSGDINKLRNLQTSFSIADEDQSISINLKLLASILRFSDEVSENHTRIEKSLLNVVPEENVLYWEYANCICGSNVLPQSKRILLNIRIPIKKSIKLYKFGNEYITLIEYVLVRINKMNKERILTSNEFKAIADIYLIEVEIELTDINEETVKFEKIIVNELFLIEESDIRSVFFKKYPDWIPETIKNTIDTEV